MSVLVPDYCLPNRATTRGDVADGASVSIHRESRRRETPAKKRRRVTSDARGQKRKGCPQIVLVSYADEAAIRYPCKFSRRRRGDPQVGRKAALRCGVLEWLLLLVWPLFLMCAKADLDPDAVIGDCVDIFLAHFAAEG